MLRCSSGWRASISELGAEDVLGRFAGKSVKMEVGFCELVSYVKVRVASMQRTASQLYCFLSIAQTWITGWFVCILFLLIMPE